MNKVLSLAKSRIIWIVNKKEHKAPAWVNSRSRSKTDGFPSPMVGPRFIYSLFLYHLPLPARNLICSTLA